MIFLSPASLHAYRLDILGNALTLAIALFGVGFRDSVSPSKFGVVLT